jgi:hypothetical protein
MRDFAWHKSITTAVAGDSQKKGLKLFLNTYYRSPGVNPVCLAIRESIRDPISSLSWKAKT